MNEVQLPLPVAAVAFLAGIALALIWYWWLTNRPPRK